MTENVQEAPKRKKRRPKFCKCGCNQKFTPERSNQVFATKSHRQNYWSDLQNAIGGKLFNEYRANQELFAEFLKHRELFLQWLKRRKSR